MAFVRASGITGCVTFYSGTNQYIPEVFRSKVAEYGYVGEDLFACFVIFTLFCGFQARLSSFLEAFCLEACLSVFFCNLVLSSIVVVVLFGICRFRLPSIYVVVVGQDCMGLTVLCGWGVRRC